MASLEIHEPDVAEKVWPSFATPEMLGSDELCGGFVACVVVGAVVVVPVVDAVVVDAVVVEVAAGPAAPAALVETSTAVRPPSAASAIAASQPQARLRVLGISPPARCSAGAGLPAVC
jgi:hypothetical protein